MHVYGVQTHRQARCPYTLTNKQTSNSDPNQLVQERVDLEALDPSLRELKQEQRQKQWRNGTYWVAFLWLVLHLGPTCLVVIPPTAGWAISHGVTVKKMPHRHAHRLVCERPRLKRGSFLPGDSSLCLLDKN